MSLRISTTFLKLASVVLLSTTTTFAVKYFRSKEENLQLKESIKLDKKTYVNDLKEIFSRYDDQVLKNRELTRANSILVSKNKKVVTVKPHTPVKVIYLEKNTTRKEIDSFQNLINEKLKEQESIQDEVDKLSQKNSELENKNRENEKIVAKTRNLTATNVIANGVKIVSNNIIETKRFNATEQIKVCFTLLENKSAVQGYKDIYLQIINPRKKVVTDKGEFVEFGNQLLRYSAKTNVFYENEELDVCVFIDPNKKDLLPGDYEINIFSGINLIGNTVFSLK
ncbi:hypothetical protein [Flavobacterium terrae]|uniref:Uncharacterized protein n=1 Tax=Flavobacterium terrae TaxID=415425 RepID=A0A1M6B931_9FLAO|nr:hypothetical protein [Flavobacterium terrae]SHI45206.1 hypothetical protein SAMN05444363_0619 [Flavobacterium terrae]